ncbi:MAG: cyclodeaminase/cyclohydrolase family protein, partial [Flavobacteriales bacterium]
GEYEGLEKLGDPKFTPDFGPAEFNSRAKQTGATAIGARDFLVAYNINLNTTSTRRANAIAFDIREAGRLKKSGNPLTGKNVLDANGEPERIPGSLKAVKGIGWYIEEYGIAQLSLNLTNINVTSVHVAFDEACAKAAKRGIRVTGSEIIGLVPKRVLIEAADYYLRKQERSLGISDAEKIKIAVKSLGLDDLAPFDANKRVIEYMIGDGDQQPLINMKLNDFALETSSESMAPGGGSISAYCGALGVSLGTMVANLSAHKRGWDDKWETFSVWASKGMEYQEKLLNLVDEDTLAFGLPKGSEEEKQIRLDAIQAATKYAIEIPLSVARTAYQSMEVMEAMVEIGNPNSITDAGVGAMCARTAVLGAIMNVKINAADLNDKTFVAQVLEESKALTEKAEALEKRLRATVDAAIS